MRFLTAPQAMADYAYFIQEVKKLPAFFNSKVLYTFKMRKVVESFLLSFSLLLSHLCSLLSSLCSLFSASCFLLSFFVFFFFQVVVFGCSYPGNLAMWMREKYPNLVHAAVSSSAPLKAQVDFKGKKFPPIKQFSWSNNSRILRSGSKCPFQPAKLLRSHPKRNPNHWILPAIRRRRDKKSSNWLQVNFPKVPRKSYLIAYFSSACASKWTWRIFTTRLISTATLRVISLESSNTRAETIWATPARNLWT